MLFNSLQFWIFFAAAITAYYAVPARYARAVLAMTSVVFYGAWNPLLVLLLASCIVFNHATGLAIGRASHRRARVVLSTAIIADLSVLGVFKYYGFFLGTITGALHLPADGFALHVVLPVGISFYTFEAIAYNVDVYRGALPPRHSLLDFAVFIAFFPHLVAGPIIRPARFFPQLHGRPMPSGDDVAWGLTQVMKGLIKKAVFADNFATVADLYFSHQAGHAGMLAAWVGTLAFSLQIYFDFAGYTDIARGCARLFGIDLPPNFERPYLASNIAEFWRRWHISLSTWLRDYLYIPLGGNRHGTMRTYVNLLITMGLGGLWHGASWNFVIWGLYHGGLLALHRVWRQWRDAAAEPAVGAVRNAVGVTTTFVLVTLGWVGFRTTNFAATAQVFRELFAGPLWPVPHPPGVFFILAGLSLAWLVLDRDRRVQDWLCRSGGSALGCCKAPVALALAGLVLEIFARFDIAVPFIYFRF